MRYDTKHATEVERATRQLVLPTSEAEAETQLTVKEELTDTNTKEIGRINIGSNKTCIREDLAKEKMVFSRESSQTIFKMGDVELIELKKSTIQCPSCLHCVFEGTFLCNCGEEAFEILKAPFRASTVETHHEAPQKASEDLRRKMMRFTCNLIVPIIGRMLGFDTWITLYNSVSSTMRRNSKEKDVCTYFIYAVLTETDRHHFCRRDQGTGKRKSNSEIYKGEKENK